MISLRELGQSKWVMGSLKERACLPSVAAKRGQGSPRAYAECTATDRQARGGTDVLRTERKTLLHFVRKASCFRSELKQYKMGLPYRV